MSQSHSHFLDNSNITRQNLKNWWKHFTAKTAKKGPDDKGKGTCEPSDVEWQPYGSQPEWSYFKSFEVFISGIRPQSIFGTDLTRAIEYASVPICMAGADGRQYVYGYIPTIVAKCGMYLKEKATPTEGIFRLSGSAKRIKELQAIFDSPPSYGKTLTWLGYSVHDAANVLRRYLNNLPDPVIPHQWYEPFRRVLVNYPDAHRRVLAYQKLIAKIPKENQNLLLYILDLLAVFSSKADQNLMPSKNLASIFQPGILSHPDHDMAPEQYKLSQEVVEFLIDYQSYFLINVPYSNSNSNISSPQAQPSTSAIASTSSEVPPPPPPPRPVNHEGNTQSLIEPADLNNPRPPPKLLTRRPSLNGDRTTGDSIANLTRSKSLGSRPLPNKKQRRRRDEESNANGEIASDLKRQVREVNQINPTKVRPSTQERSSLSSPASSLKPDKSDKKPSKLRKKSLHKVHPKLSRQTRMSASQDNVSVSSESARRKQVRSNSVSGSSKSGARNAIKAQKSKNTNSESGDEEEGKENSSASSISRKSKRHVRYDLEVVRAVGKRNR
ncbi:4197_t:CDS:2 [Paraglomus occultum]|uniref:4197_t:CDS:1 n=1 Tax=Paraglomus occultum TaxID=144539 RepID=A0A9N9FK84_9GLOM|nr:4197_t:CDS:2 [Paraglomus occultum]